MLSVNLHLWETGCVVADLAESHTYPPTLDITEDGVRLMTVFLGRNHDAVSLEIVRELQRELDKIEAALVLYLNLAAPVARDWRTSVLAPGGFTPEEEAILQAQEGVAVPANEVRPVGPDQTAVPQVQPRSSAAINTNIIPSRTDAAHSAASRKKYGRG